MSEMKIKMFVLIWTDKIVICDCFEVKEIREFELYPLFQDMKLFKGKNVWLETNFKEGTMIVKNNESKKSRFVQLWNFCVKKSF